MRSSFCSGIAILACAGFLSACGESTDSAAASGLVCDEPLTVLAQPRESLAMLESDRAEFVKLAGADFKIDYLNENDRRAKSRLEAATTGRYNVYYVDEASMPLFASKGWIVPITDHYPEQYAFDDFEPGRKQVLTYGGKVYAAPLQGGGDLMYYRKDLLEKAGVAPPKTLADLQAALPKLHDPANGVYAIALRGGRGSGANVWRWSPYFYGAGGRLANQPLPKFNSPAGAQSTQTYVSLFRYAPPSTRTGSWTEATEAFNSGSVAIIIESAPLAAMTEDSKQSSVAGKVGYAPPPAPLASAAYAHGLAIGAKANGSDRAKRCAATFIAWATSKEQEQKRLAAGNFGDLNRTSIFASPQFAQRYSAELVDALGKSAQQAKVTFWNDPDWPEVGDRWGILLEELIAGSRTDIPAALAEVDATAGAIKARRQ